MVEFETVSSISLLNGSSCSTIARCAKMSWIIRCYLRLICSNGHLVISRGILPWIIYLYRCSRISLWQLEASCDRLRSNLSLASRTICSPNLITFFPKVFYRRTSWIGYIKGSTSSRLSLFINIYSTDKSCAQYILFVIILVQIVSDAFFIGASYSKYH